MLQAVITPVLQEYAGEVAWANVIYDLLLVADKDGAAFGGDTQTSDLSTNCRRALRVLLRRLSSFLIPRVCGR